SRLPLWATTPQPRARVPGSMPSAIIPPSLAAHFHGRKRAESVVRGETPALRRAGLRMPRRPPWLIPAHARQERSSVGETERALRGATQRACSSTPSGRGAPDIVGVGSGRNGRVAGCLLARWGFRVVVREAHPRRPGGALGTEELTLPGFAHDVGP